MTVVLVHGVPETDAIWGGLVEALGRDDVVCLSPPAFGAPLPDDFPATMTAYRDWLEVELMRFGAPVDLVGHDWGGGHVVNLVMHRPELVRSWASDVVGLFDPDYVWHDRAQVWQKPGAGEEAIEAMMGLSVDEQVTTLTAAGYDADVVAAMASARGPEMGRAILALYRSAAQPQLAVAGRELPNAAARPGLAIVAKDDPFVGTEEMRRRAAERAGARTVVIDGSHAWMMQDPAHGARVLTEFWDSL